MPVCEYSPSLCPNFCFLPSCTKVLCAENHSKMSMQRILGHPFQSTTQEVARSYILQPKCHSILQCTPTRKQVCKASLGLLHLPLALLVVTLRFHFLPALIIVIVVDSHSTRCASVCDNRSDGARCEGGRSLPIRILLSYRGDRPIPLSESNIAAFGRSQGWCITRTSVSVHRREVRIRSLIPVCHARV